MFTDLIYQMAKKWSFDLCAWKFCGNYTFDMGCVLSTCYYMPFIPLMLENDKCWVKGKGNQKILRQKIMKNWK